MLTDSETENEQEQQPLQTKKKFPYPKCWENDVRMNVLMSPFRPRSVNPENYDSKINFWQEMIKRYCEHKGTPHFNKKDIQQSFQRKGRVPYDLDTVLNDMHSKSKLRPKAEFMYDPLNSWTGWAINSFVKKPLFWGAKKILPLDNSEAADFVHVDICKDMSSNLHSVLKPFAGKLISKDTLEDILKGKSNLNAEGLETCLQYLQAQKKLVVEYKTEEAEKKVHLVKVLAIGDAPQITETDRAVFNLEETQKSLMKQIEALEEDIKKNDDMTRQYVREGKKQLAKTYLRKKHLLEKNHEKRSLALHNIDTMLASVEETKSNGEIVDAYKFGAKALQTMLNDSGLKVDNVDQVMNDVREAVDNHNEIQETLAAVNVNDNFDEDELESELKDIMGEPDTNANNLAQMTTEAITVTDAELMELLDGLQVEESSPVKAECERKNIQA